MFDLASFSFQVPINASWAKAHCRCDKAQRQSQYNRFCFHVASIANRLWAVLCAILVLRRAFSNSQPTTSHQPPPSSPDRSARRPPWPREKVTCADITLLFFGNCPLLCSAARCKDRITQRKVTAVILTSQQTQLCLWQSVKGEQKAMKKGNKKP